MVRQLTVSSSGSQLTISIPVSFTLPMFGGPKNLYAYAEDNANLNSGWQTVGSWTVR